MDLPGKELFWDATLGAKERWYCRLFGVPIVGLRIRLRRLDRLLPPQATRILDAGCGRGVISRVLAQRYPNASVDAIDQAAKAQENNQRLAEKMGLENCHFLAADLNDFNAIEQYDLIVSVDNLEHIQDDKEVLLRFYRAMLPGGVLVVHVPHFYRRWPVFKWTKNFDVPGHVRPGYHLPELVERIKSAGFEPDRVGFSYGFLENLANNIGYAITAAEERHKMVYAAAFPLLNSLAWCGQWSWPKMGAGVWMVARKDIITTMEDTDENAGDVD